ncbi:MAG: hypothetical protein XD72_0812 [Methanothrix harundinacea]|jgi:hypothetical protein|uniref:Uncharacterized protein n=1 Tax=Methanothrix harundinacea TaxID=301375 RepID=A0A101IKD2_9EURY|nr:MAG: hypothetical protein XD72_0812 [Methanothrix harundinacea]KUK96860.1 MAG: hypothetical protein XE07_0811 [Methanothrix harundinacea]
MELAGRFIRIGAKGADPEGRKLFIAWYGGLLTFAFI